MTLAEKLARPEILALAPYKSARGEGGADDLIWLDASENPYQPFPADGSTQGFNRYPEQQPAKLIRRMAAYYDVPEPFVLASRGADEGIDLLVRAFCRPGVDSILFTSPTFDMYRVSAEVQGAGIVNVPLVEGSYSLDVEGIKKACTDNENIKLVFICSPNNPTANLLDRDAICDICRTLTDKALVVVDEAYIEFSEKESLATELTNYPNLVILRTLSKAFGLAGARVGALLAQPDIIAVLRKVMAIYPLTVPSISAALKALSPAGILWMKDTVKTLLEERQRLEKALANHPDICRIYPSDTNFLFLETTDASVFVETCKKTGFLIRNRHKDRPNCIRLSVGTPDENTLLLKGLGLDAGETKKERTATISRTTKETDISVTVNLDRAGLLSIQTGIGFYDHMLEQIGKHGGFGLVVHCNGDTHIDDHHTIEDCAIALGSAFKQALGDKRGINRYAFTVPMDESQASIVLDLSGRSALKFEGDFPTEKVGEMATEMVPHFFQSLADSLAANIHVNVTGDNSHHMVEGCFKALARALRTAVRQEGDELPSTKGVL